jgi:hypothetical protein
MRTRFAAISTPYIDLGRVEHKMLLAAQGRPRAIR